MSEANGGTSLAGAGTTGGAHPALVAEVLARQLEALL
jgi:hypothetical protein